MTSSLKRGRDEKGGVIPVSEPKRVWLSYDALHSMGVLCEKGRRFTTDDTETTGCVYAHVHREAKHRRPAKMVYARGRRRYICDLDQELVLGFCCVCGIDVSNLKSEEVTLQSTPQMLCQKVSDEAAKKEPVLYVCADCSTLYKVKVGDKSSEQILNGKLTWYEDSQHAVDLKQQKDAALSKAKPIILAIQKKIGRKLTPLQLRQLERLHFNCLVPELTAILAKYSAEKPPPDCPFLELASRAADSAADAPK